MYKTFVFLTNSNFDSINKAPRAVHGQLDKRTQKQYLRQQITLIIYLELDRFIGVYRDL